MFHLRDDALAILEAMPRFRGDCVFSTTAGAKPCSGFSKPKRYSTGMPGSDWRLHDLRRTVRTGLAALKIPDVTAEMVIGHGRRGIGRVYDLHQYQSEMREALNLKSEAARYRDAPACQHRQAEGHRMRTVRVDFSQAKRRRGRPHSFSGPSMQAETRDWIVRLMRHAEDQLKAAGWRYGFRKEAERQVREYLARQGYTDSRDWPGARRRGKKKGGPKPAR